MSRSPKNVNPFYVVLVIVGVAFAVTACAYAVMVVKNLEPSRRAAETGGLMVLLEQHGFTILMVELGLLTVTTVAAISTDSLWSRPRLEPSSLSQGPEEPP